MRRFLLLAVSGCAAMAGSAPAWAASDGPPLGGRLVAAKEQVSRASREALAAAMRVHARARSVTRTFANVARTDVVLTLANPAGVAQSWTHAYDMDPRAEVVGASFGRPGGPETRARTLPTEQAADYYGRTERPTTGRDPLWVRRESPDRLDVSVTPVPAGGVVTVRLTFVTPLSGRGAALTHDDPIRLDPERSSPAPTTPRDPEPVSPHVLEGVAATYAPGAFGAPTGGTPEPVRSRARVASGASAAREVAHVFPAGGYPLFTSGFACRVDPERVVRAMGLVPSCEVRFLVREVGGATYRVAPASLLSTDGPTLVMGRTRTKGEVRIAFEARDWGNVLLGRRECVFSASPERIDASMAETLLAYHRARLVERAVDEWAGDREGRLARVTQYAVDLGVVRRGSSLLAIPKDEQDFLTLRERHTYATDGAAWGGGGDSVDFAPPPPGAFR
jgi:hypothetical protein